MNTDIRISTSFFSSPKTKILIKKLGMNGVGCLIKLWTTTATEKPDGILRGWSSEMIEVVSDWDGEDGLFFDTIVRLKFLDVDDGVISIHNWIKRQPWAANAEDRSLAASKNQAIRWCFKLLRKEDQDDFRKWFETYDYQKGIKASDIVSEYCSYTDRIRPEYELDTPSPSPYPSPPPSPPKEEENNIPDSVPDSGTRTEVENERLRNGHDESREGAEGKTDEGPGDDDNRLPGQTDVQGAGLGKDGRAQGDNPGTGGGERSASQGAGCGMEGAPGTGGPDQGAGGGEGTGSPPAGSAPGNSGSRPDGAGGIGSVDVPKKDEPRYRTKKNKWLKGQRLTDFEEFWKAFHEYGAKKNGKAPAADSWLNLKDYSPELVKWIVSAAKQYAEERDGILQRGGTPKWAQGWLTDRRWEDYPPPSQERQKRRFRTREEIYAQYGRKDLQEAATGTNGKNPESDPVGERPTPPGPALQVLFGG